jgi:hypothetical protein
MRPPINHGALPVPHACRTPAAERYVTEFAANRPARTEQLFRGDDKKQMRDAGYRSLLRFTCSGFEDGPIQRTAISTASGDGRSLLRLPNGSLSSAAGKWRSATVRSYATLARKVEKFPHKFMQL